MTWFVGSLPRFRFHLSRVSQHNSYDLEKQGDMHHDERVNLIYVDGMEWYDGL